MLPMRLRIGGQIDPDAVRAARDGLRDKELAPLFFKYPRAKWAIECFRESDVPRAIVDLWLENENNIDRVAKYFGKEVPVKDKMMEYFTAMRTRAMEAPKTLKGGIWEGTKVDLVMVIIPLEDWNATNGLWPECETSEIKAGQDISIMSDEVITATTTGGCHCIMFSLRM